MESDKRTVVAFAANAALAGGNAVAIRFSNRELAPLWGATLRFAVASLVLFAVMAVRRRKLPAGRALVGAVVFGLLQFAGAFGLYYYALVRLHAGLGQTMLALVPLATLLLAVGQGQDRLQLSSVSGAILGVAGVAVISNASVGDSVPALSLLAVIGTIFCFGQAAVVVRRFPPVHPVSMNAAGMAAGTVVLLLASLAAGESRVLPQRPETWLALGYVSVVGSVAVFLLFLYVLSRWSAARASYVMVVIPFVTVLLSAWLDHEPIRPGLIAGALLIVAGVYVGVLRSGRAPTDPRAGCPS